MSMWLFYAIGSAFFAGVTAILAKCGIKKTDSSIATAIRTVVVLVFSWIMVMVVGSQKQIYAIDGKTFWFLVLSGVATGASWLCYFKALQVGDINKVVAVDKSSIILTVLFAFLILQETVTIQKAIGITAIGIGTWLMIQKKEEKAKKTKKTWLIYAGLSALFASLTTILGKIGIENLESNLGSAIRTFVVLIMAWLVVFVTGKSGEVKKVPRRELAFIGLSGIATGASWLCYYKALQEGPASVVVPIDKMSILVTVLFSYIVFHEKLSKKAFLGLILMTIGTMIMLF